MSYLEPEDEDYLSEEETDNEDEIQRLNCVGHPYMIQVNTLIGTHFHLGIFPVDTIHVVKQRIGVQESLNPAHQHLLLGSRELENHEIAQDIGLVYGSQLTLIMTLRGGPAPVAQRQRENLLAAIQNPAVAIRAGVLHTVSQRRGEESNTDEENEGHMAEYLEIVLVKCDGSVHIYYVPKALANAGSSSASSTKTLRPTAPGSKSVHQLAPDVYMYTDSEDEDSDSEEDEEMAAQAVLTPQVAVENCRTRSRMVALQNRMARKREKKRKGLIKQTQASQDSARRKIPSPREKPYSMQPSHERVHQYPKTLGYIKATQRMKLVNTEMYLQTKRYKKVYGWSPYSMRQLDEYVTAKLHVLIEDEGYERPTALFPTATSLTPTVLLKDAGTSSSSEHGGETTESNRSQILTSRTAGSNNCNRESTNTSQLITRCTTTALTRPHQHEVESPQSSRREKPAAGAATQRKAKTPAARPTTCINLPFNEDLGFSYYYGYDSCDYDEDDEILDSTCHDEEEDLLLQYSKHLPHQPSTNTNSRIFNLAQIKLKNDTRLINSLTHAFNRAGVKSARLKYKTLSSGSGSSQVSGDSTAATTTEQEPVLDQMAERKPSSIKTTNSGSNTSTKSNDTLTPTSKQVEPKTATTDITAAAVSAASTVSVSPKKSPSASTSKSMTQTSAKTKKKTNSAGGSKNNSDAKRCSECKKKLSIVNEYECRCGLYFCSKHRYAEAHNCTFDYKAEGRRIIEQANPVVTAPKVKRI